MTARDARGHACASKMAFCHVLDVIYVFCNLQAHICVRNSPTESLVTPLATLSWESRGDDNWSKVENGAHIILCTFLQIVFFHNFKKNNKSFILMKYSFNNVSNKAYSVN